MVISNAHRKVLKRECDFLALEERKGGGMDILGAVTSYSDGICFSNSSLKSRVLCECAMEIKLVANLMNSIEGSLLSILFNPAWRKLVLQLFREWHSLTSSGPCAIKHQPTNTV